MYPMLPAKLSRFKFFSIAETSVARCGAAAALAAGFIRDATGHYNYAWLGAAAMCTVAAVISATIRKDAAKKQPKPVSA